MPIDKIYPNSDPLVELARLVSGGSLELRPRLVQISPKAIKQLEGEMATEMQSILRGFEKREITIAEEPNDGTHDLFLNRAKSQPATRIWPTHFLHGRQNLHRRSAPAYLRDRRKNPAPLALRAGHICLNDSTHLSFTRHVILFSQTWHRFGDG